jgi:hypothetical protein
LEEVHEDLVLQAQSIEALTADHFAVYGGLRGKFQINDGLAGTIALSEFKTRLESTIGGQPLSIIEQEIPVEPVTSPYLYSGRSWSHPPNPVVYYRINENIDDCTGEGSAVQAAAATWNAAGAKFSFNYAGSTAATVGGYNGSNDVLWTYLGTYGTVAQATTWSYEFAPTIIIEGDIEFNSYYYWSTAASPPGGYYDVQSIGLHELGHFLNLSDLYGGGDSAKVMYGVGSPGQ